MIQPWRLRDTEHFFLDLGKLAEDGLADWVSDDKDHWRPQVINFARNLVLNEGLRGRAVTRDLDWGVAVPVDGWNEKVLYVWFEAVIGYLSASIEWSKNQGQPDAWKQWWYEPSARTYYFVGKDNIPFHAIIWPAELSGVERLYEGDPQKSLESAVRCAGERVHEYGGAQDQRKSEMGRLDVRCPGKI